ncbi:MAG TPA: phosphoethanolamine transferase, partial [Methylophilaceae bacterium]|nr:phosphoethanolamine transferase [Methylophilaceae bacterium]
MKLSKLVTAQHRRILAVAVFLMATGNATMFQQLWQAYPPADGGLPFIISLAVFFTLATALWLTLIGFGRLTT